MSAVPPTFKSLFATQQFNMAIGAGGQQAPYEYNYVINFDNSEWQAFNYVISVTATQTYPVTFGAVDLTANAAYAGQSVPIDMQWNVTNANTQQEKTNGGFGATGLQYTTSGSKLDVLLSYMVPAVVATPAVATVSVTTTVTFESYPGIVPTTMPSMSAANVTNKGNSNVGGLGGLLSFLTSPTGIIVAVIGAAALGAILLSPAGQESTTIITSGFNRAKRRIRRK